MVSKYLTAPVPLKRYGSSQRLRIRSLVGIIPLLAVEVINSSIFERMREFNSRAVSIIRTHPDLA